MTQRETTSFLLLQQSFNQFVKQDAEWKEKIEKKLDPLVEQNVTQTAINERFKFIVKIGVGVIAFFVSLGYLTHQVIAPIWEAITRH